MVLKAKSVLKVIIPMLAVVAVVAGVLIADTRATQVYARTHDFHVVIDAGHGGKDRGASSPKGITERDINLSIAKHLAKELEALNVGVTLTRQDHNWLASPFAGNKKMDDLNKRREIIEKVAPDLVISIHLNSFPQDTTVRGLQVFYDKSSTESKKYADAVQYEINRNIPHVYRLAKTGDYYILQCTQFPSILVECGFLSNPMEERMLQTDEYQKIIAHHIGAAILSARG